MAINSQTRKYVESWIYDAAASQELLGYFDSVVALGTISTQAADAVAITGGTIDGTTIGATTPASARTYRPANPQTGTTYTLALADNGKIVTCSNAAPITLTVPTNTAVAFPVGAEVDIAQIGAGLVTVAAAIGATVSSLGGLLDLGGQYAGAKLKKIATNIWLLTGDIA